MDTKFTVVFKQGNTIDTFPYTTYTAEEAIQRFWAGHYGNQFHVLAVMPTEVFELLPDASVFFGIFPY